LTDKASSNKINDENYEQMIAAQYETLQSNASTNEQTEIFVSVLHLF